MVYLFIIGMMIDAGPKFYVIFLNSVVYLFHVWHDDRCWSKILCYTIANPVFDFKVKVTDLNFCIALFYNFCFFFKPSMDFIHLWHDDRALSKILCSTSPIPVHGLKVKVMDIEFFVFNFYSVSFCKAFD